MRGSYDVLRYSTVLRMIRYPGPRQLICLGWLRSSPDSWDADVILESCSTPESRHDS